MSGRPLPSSSHFWAQNEKPLKMTLVTHPQISVPFRKSPSEGPLFWPDSPGIICLLWQRDSSSPVSPQSRCDEARQPPEAGQPPHLAANKSKLSSVMQRYQSGPHVVRLGEVVVGEPPHHSTSSVTTPDYSHKHHQQTCYGR